MDVLARADLDRKMGQARWRLDHALKTKFDVMQ
jgi:hypothetical protein